MLNQIENFENNNLKNQMKSIVDESVKTVFASVDDPVSGAEIRNASF
jgi:hypothetical protein